MVNVPDVTHMRVICFVFHIASHMGTWPQWVLASDRVGLGGRSGATFGLTLGLLGTILVSWALSHALHCKDPCDGMISVPQRWAIWNVFD